MGMSERLGREARQARENAGLTMMEIAVAAQVSQSTIHAFETGRGWRRQTDQLVATYEHELGLEEGELWRRAVCQ
jgi:transcriptional regulator with XRE-family HTH domain